MAPFYPLKKELFEAQGLLFRMEWIALPKRLQQNVKTAHQLGHLGMTKIKHMLRAKFWFSGMNVMIDQTIGHCFDCQVPTKDHKKEPVNPSVIPERNGSKSRLILVDPTPMDIIT